MISLQLSDIAQMLDAPFFGNDVTVDSVSTDSRTLTGAALFIALKGANFDGNRFLADVAAKGAVALVCSEKPPVDIPYILVADGRLALGKFAAALKQKLAPKTIAVTGSAGKTTVKEMLYAILSQQAEVLATAGNFNNDIGVPLTMLRLTQAHQYAVLELGANHHGEIAYTTALAKPDVALITNAAASHLEGFGDIAGVARAKAEIYAGLGSSGTAIVSLDSDYSNYWLQQVDALNTTTFSIDKTNADIYASGIQLDQAGCAQFVLHTPTGHITVQLAVPGRHNVANALAAAAAALAVGVELTQIQQGLAQMHTVKGRTNIQRVNAQLQIIDDTYNANVESVKAAIDLLASYVGFRGLLLGDMGELGENARFYHEQVGEYAQKAGINLLFTVGVLSQHASDAFRDLQGSEATMQSAHFSQRQSMLNQLLPQISTRQDVTLLVKGSRSAKMELVVQDLLERSQQESSPC